MSAIEQLFSVDHQQFLSDHWPKSPLWHHAPLSRLPELSGSPPLQSFEALLAGHRGSTRVIFTDDEGAYRQSYVQPEQAAVLYHGGMTVCLGSVHLWVPALREWTSRLEEELGLPLGSGQCNAYASKAGRGFSKHFDDREVVVLQIHGEKRWRIAPNREIASPTSNYIPSKGLSEELQQYVSKESGREMPPDSEEIRLRPGSTLFLPRGYWHETDGSMLSLSLTFGFFTPTPMEILLDHIRYHLLQNDDWREPVGGAWRAGAQRQTSADRLGRMIVELTDHLVDLDPEELLQGFKSWRLLDSQTRYRKDAGKSLSISVSPSEDVTKAMVNDGSTVVLEIELGTDLEPLFRWLADRSQPFVIREACRPFPVIPPQMVSAALEALVSSGYLVPSEPSS